MSRNYGGGKRQREAERERKKKDKAERLRRNRMARPQGAGPGMEMSEPERLPPVALEDVVISVPSRSRTDSTGPVRLFVGGLDFNTSLETLRSAFERFGPIEDAVIVIDRMTGRSRGFGFVTFSVGAAARAALGGMDGQELDGRILRVNNADSR